MAIKKSAVAQPCSTPAQQSRPGLCFPLLQFASFFVLVASSSRGAAKYLSLAGDGGGVRHDGIVFPLAAPWFRRWCITCCAREVKLYARWRHGETGGPAGRASSGRMHYLFNHRFALMRSSYTSLRTGAWIIAARVLYGFALFVAGL